MINPDLNPQNPMQAALDAVANFVEDTPALHLSTPMREALEAVKNFDGKKVTFSAWAKQKLHVIAAFILIVLPLAGCASMDFPAQSTLPTAAISSQVTTLDFTDDIKQAKASCAAHSYAKGHRNFLRTKCENIALRNMARPELDAASFHAFDGFLIKRLKIADQLDRRVISPEQSEVAILEAQQKLLSGNCN